MRQVHGVERTDERDVVDVSSQVREKLGHPHATLAVTLKRERTLHQRAGLGRTLHFSGDLFEVGLTVVFGQHLFRIKEVHLTRTAIHKEMDDGFRLRLEVRLFWGKIIDAR